MSLKTHYSFSHSHSLLPPLWQVIKLRNVAYKSVLCYLTQGVLCYIIQVFLLHFTACSTLRCTHRPLLHYTVYSILQYAEYPYCVKQSVYVAWYACFMFMPHYRDGSMLHWTVLSMLRDTKNPCCMLQGSLNVLMRWNWVMCHPSCSKHVWMQYCIVCSSASSNFGSMLFLCYVYGDFKCTAGKA
jgi:hypothetical protein